MIRKLFFPLDFSNLKFRLYCASKNLLVLTTIYLSACSSLQKQNISDPVAVNNFINKMVVKHHFYQQDLNQLLNSVEIKSDIINKVSKPAESMPWYKYRQIFMTDSRVEQGVKFWQENANTLEVVSKETGVPAEIIIAIIGVETLYGQKMGTYRVVDALYSLAFAYPPRSQFFTNELEQFLLLCRDEQINPLEPLGSYAGAMGAPQFMPSSYQVYAVDYDGDGHRDIWHNKNDEIASVANYFKKHGWQPGQEILVPVSATGEKYKKVLSEGLKPNLRVEELDLANLKTLRSLPLNTKVKLLSFEMEASEQGNREELWAGLENFYVITRYNHSPLYALAVYQLSQAILNKKGEFP